MKKTKKELKISLKQAIMALLPENQNGAISANDIRECFAMLIDVMEERLEKKK